MKASNFYISGIEKVYGDHTTAKTLARKKVKRWTNLIPHLEGHKPIGGKVLETFQMGDFEFDLRDPAGVHSMDFSSFDIIPATDPIVYYKRIK